MAIQSSRFTRVTEKPAPRPYVINTDDNGISVITCANSDIALWIETFVYDFGEKLHKRGIGVNSVRIIVSPLYAIQDVVDYIYSLPNIEDFESWDDIRPVFAAYYGETALETFLSSFSDDTGDDIDTIDFDTADLHGMFNRVSVDPDN